MTEPLPTEEAGVAEEAQEVPEAMAVSEAPADEDAVLAVIPSAAGGQRLAAVAQYLAQHLRAWLASAPPNRSFEAWLALQEAQLHQLCRQIWERIMGRIPDQPPSSPANLQIADIPAPSAPPSSGSSNEIPESAPSAPRPSNLPGQAQSSSASGIPQSSTPTEADPVWKECAVPWIANSLPMAAAAMRLQPWLGNWFKVAPSEVLLPRMQLLATVLRDSGPAFDEVAAAADTLACGSGHAAELTIKAAELSHEHRLIYARAICACCPQALLLVLPPTMLASPPSCFGPFRSAWFS